MMGMEQARRRHILDEGCKKLNLSRSLLDVSERYTGHLIVDDEYKILFNFIPKVSCTTWKSLFSKLRRTHSNINGAYLFTYTEEEKRYRLKHYRKAVFIREPITRLLSLYLSAFCNRKDLQRTWERFYGHRIVELYRKCHKPTEPAPFFNITLIEFIQFITDLGDGTRLHNISDHFLPQNLIATPCAIHYDFIGHYENLTTEAPYMLKYLGVNHAIEYPPIHQSAGRNKLVDEYKKVPLDLMNRLRKYYHADYELFGYSFGDTLQSIVQAMFFNDDDYDSV